MRNETPGEASFANHRWLLALALAGCEATPETPGPGERAPVEGTLALVQLHLTGFSTGQSALIVGPDGTTVLLDVGNDSHDDEVRTALLAYGGEETVDWVVLTHAHGDHIGAFDDLFTKSDPVAVRQGVVTRGGVDLKESAASLSEWRETCGTTLPQVALCDADPEAPCSGTAGVPWPATGCPGLEAGDLAVTGDEGPAFIALGVGARLEILAADGWVGDRQMVLDHAEGEDENARSLVVRLSWADFDFVWGGDLTGGGKGTPDAEGFVVEALGDQVRPADVLSLNHHGISSSTSEAWLDAWLPQDGRPKGVIVGTNHVYLDAPADVVLERIGDRVGDAGVWVTEDGSTAGAHPRGCVANGDVVLTVEDGRYWDVAVPAGLDCATGPWDARSD